MDRPHLLRLVSLAPAIAVLFIVCLSFFADAQDATRPAPAGGQSVSTQAAGQAGQGGPPAGRGRGVLGAPELGDPANANADFSPRAPVVALSPADQAKQFWLPPSYRLEPVLADPLIEEPGQIVFDGNGRMFLVELRGYYQSPEGIDRIPPDGRISMHEDRDGDGVYERHTVFVDKMVFPRFALPFGPNAILTMETNTDEVWKYADTNGDGIADKKDLFTTGFGRAGTMESQQSTLFWGMDNWLYSAHQIWAKYSHMDAFVSDLFTFPIGSSDDAGGDTTVSQYTVGQTWTLKPTLLMDSSFGASLNDQIVTSPDFGLGMLGLDMGIPGTNDQGRGDPRYAGMPTFTTGFAALGNTPTWSPIFMEQRAYSFNTNLTKIRGTHELKAGYFVNKFVFSNWQPERANPRGSFLFAGNPTRTFGTGSQTANFYNMYAAFLLGLVNTGGKSYQYELFTSNEWQHALFFRDRWNINPKLTLDVGLRWEYYPILRRADRQIEMLDLNTLDVLIGGVAGNPKNMGLVAPKDSFLPRACIVYRLDDKTVIRTGYGLTVNPLNLGSQAALGGDFSYPQVLNATFEPPAAQAQFGWYGTLDQGIPRLDDPNLSSGRIHLPNTVGMRTAVPETVNRGKTHSWNVSFERRLAFDISADVAYVGNKIAGDLASINVNNAQTMGGGGLDRPYLVSHGRQLAVDIFTPYRRARYDALQLGVTRPFLNGLLIKGHYTYSRSWSLATNYQLPTPDAQDRNWARAAGDRPHTVAMSFVYQLPWHRGFEPFNIFRAIVNDWQVNGIYQAFSGAPFTVTADGTVLNTPGNTQTADLVGSVVKVGEIGADGVYFEPSAWAQPDGVRFGTSRLNEFRGPGGWNLDFSLFRTFTLTGSHRLEARIEASNVTDTPKFANPTSSLTSGDFMRIFGLNPAFSGREVRLALRYSF